MKPHLQGASLYVTLRDGLAVLGRVITRSRFSTYFSTRGLTSRLPYAQAYNMQISAILLCILVHSSIAVHRLCTSALCLESSYTARPLHLSAPFPQYKQLVLVNLHLEAYDDGEGKIAQTKQLREFIEREYEKGNYVIAGGDFNQIFPGGLDAFPNEHPELWSPGILDNSMLPGEGWQFAYDLETSSCRLLNQPYNPADTKNTQHYVIDGFILSPNVQLESVTCTDLGFENSDHNPVVMRVVLG